jgi:hypothetical protein
MVSVQTVLLARVYSRVFEENMKGGSISRMSKWVTHGVVLVIAGVAAIASMPSVALPKFQERCEDGDSGAMPEISWTGIGILIAVVVGLGIFLLAELVFHTGADSTKDALNTISTSQATP